MDAGITTAAFFRMKMNLLVLPEEKGSFGTFFHAGPAASAEISGLRIMTVAAVKITALQKDGRPVSRSVHCTEGNDLNYRHPVAAFRRGHDRFFLLSLNYHIVFLLSSHFVQIQSKTIIFIRFR